MSAKFILLLLLLVVDVGSLGSSVFAGPQVTLPSDLTDGQNYGQAVAVSGTVALVGAPWVGPLPQGGVYVLEHAGDFVWAEIAVLMPADECERAVWVCGCGHGDHACRGRDRGKCV